MANEGIDLGIADVDVLIGTSLPNIDVVATKLSFDASAEQYDSYKQSPYFTAFLTERMTDDAQTIDSIIPARRFYYVDNFLASFNNEQNDEEIEQKVLFTPIANPDVESSVFGKMINRDKNPFLTHEFVEPGTYDNISGEYNGPKWEDITIQKDTPPNDISDIKQFIASIGGSLEAPVPPDIDQKIVTVGYVFQSEVKEGMYWGLESDSFLATNQPFWVLVRRPQPPSSEVYDTVFVIELGSSDETQRYEILLPTNGKPRIADWIKDSETGSDLLYMEKEFDIEGSRLWSYTEENAIGIMTIAGRLVVTVNGFALVYARIDQDPDADEVGSLYECKISAGTIKLWGTNAQCAVNVSYMTFAPAAAFAIPVPSLVSEGSSQNNSVQWDGQDHKGEVRGSVAELPGAGQDSDTVYGVDCEDFKGIGGTCSPDGDFFHQNGTIELYDGAEFETLGQNFIACVMYPSDAYGSIPNSGCPYFFRLRGVRDPEVGDAGADFLSIASNLISMTETATAPDYFHVKKTLDVTLYDNGLSASLIPNQTSIQAMWDGEVTFTGIVVNVSLSQKAGMETINLRCEDYMRILSDTPIVNSPFYDGMVAFYAIEDMAKRAGIAEVTNAWVDEDEFFLPSGYSFSKPAMRYNSSQMIFECMMDIIKRYEAFIYFDPDGILVVEKLTGGLFSDSGAGSSEDFYSNPEDTTNEGQIILEEKQVELDFSSTVDRIVVITVERDTRMPIFYSKTADEPKILYKKPLLLNQAALGEISVARAYAEDLGQRVFSGIKKARWKAYENGQVVQPLEYATLDGQLLRVISMKKVYNAETNEKTVSFEGEWLAGDA